MTEEEKNRRRQRVISDDLSKGDNNKGAKTREEKLKERHEKVQKEIERLEKDKTDRENHQKAQIEAVH